MFWPTRPYVWCAKAWLHTVGGVIGTFWERGKSERRMKSFQVNRSKVEHEVDNKLKQIGKKSTDEGWVWNMLMDGERKSCLLFSINNMTYCLVRVLGMMRSGGGGGGGTEREGKRETERNKGGGEKERAREKKNRKKERSNWRTKGQKDIVGERNTNLKSAKSRLVLCGVFSH